MDVPPCNPLLDLWIVAMVLSMTLNGSSESRINHLNSLGIERPALWLPAFFFVKDLSQLT
jgi:hypothetical protein